MYRIYSILYVILMFAFGYWATESYRQERAKLTYYNPKYITDIIVFTGRKSRNAPYVTNMTGTTLVPFADNVSIAITLTLKSGGDFRVVAKACESFKPKWMHEFVSLYTNLTLNKCPIPPGRYIYMNMELPPKNIPIPMADGDYFIKYELFMTATKAPIVTVETLLHFDQNARKPRGKGTKG